MLAKFAVPLLFVGVVYQLIALRDEDLKDGKGEIKVHGANNVSNTDNPRLKLDVTPSQQLKTWITKDLGLDDPDLTNANIFMVIGNGDTLGFASLDEQFQPTDELEVAVNGIVKAIVEESSGVSPLVVYYGDEAAKAGIGAVIAKLAAHAEFLEIGGKLLMIQIDGARGYPFDCDNFGIHMLGNPGAMKGDAAEKLNACKAQLVPSDYGPKLGDFTGGALWHAGSNGEPTSNSPYLSEYGGVRQDLTPSGNSIKFVELQKYLVDMKSSIKTVFVVGDGGLITLFEILIAKQLEIPVKYFSALSLNPARVPPLMTTVDDGKGGTKNKDTGAPANSKQQAILCKMATDGFDIDEAVRVVREDREEGGAPYTVMNEETGYAGFQAPTLEC